MPSPGSPTSERAEPPLDAVTSTIASPASAPAAPPVDPQVVEAMHEELRREQRFGAAVVAGAAAMLAGAAVWAAITVATGYQIGWMAVGVGALVGLVIRRTGRGVEPRFGLAGAALALAGCMLGNLFAAVGFVAKEAGAPFFELLFALDFTIVKELLSATFAPMDLLFYGIAVTEGYRLAFQRVNRQTLGATIAKVAPDSTKRG